MTYEATYHALEANRKASHHVLPNLDHQHLGDLDADIATAENDKTLRKGQISAQAEEIGRGDGKLRAWKKRRTGF